MYLAKENNRGISICTRFLDMSGSNVFIEEEPPKCEMNPITLLVEQIYRLQKIFIFWHGSISMWIPMDGTHCMLLQSMQNSDNNHSKRRLTLGSALEDLQHTEQLRATPADRRAALGDRLRPGPAPGTAGHNAGWGGGPLPNHPLGTNQTGNNTPPTTQQELPARSGLNKWPQG